MSRKLSDLGFNKDPDFDNTPIWNALAACGPSRVEVDGVYTFKTRPNPISRPMRFEGETINSSGFRRDYHPTTSTEVFLDFCQTCRVDGVAVTAHSGEGGIGARFHGLSASASVLRDAYITAQAGANWLVALNYWSADPLGIRSCLAQNVELFASSAHVLWVCNAKGLTLDNVNCYPAGGTSRHATVQGVNGHRSAKIRWTTRYLEKVWVYDTDDLLIDALDPVEIVPSSSTEIIQRGG